MSDRETQRLKTWVFIRHNLSWLFGWGLVAYEAMQPGEPREAILILAGSVILYPLGEVAGSSAIAAVTARRSGGDESSTPSQEPAPSQQS